MSWLSKWWKVKKEKGFWFSVTRPWPGEKDLPTNMGINQKITNKSINKRFAETLDKGGKDGTRSDNR